MNFPKIFGFTRYIRFNYNKPVKFSTIKDATEIVLHVSETIPNLMSFRLKL